MSPVPTYTVAPSGIKTLPATLMATSSPDPTDSDDVQKGGFNLDASTIAAIALGVALFFTILGILGYCVWRRRRESRHYKHRVQGGSGQWTVVKPAEKRKRSNGLPTYVKRISVSKSYAGIDISTIGHPKLIQSSHDPVLTEPKAAYIRAHKGAITVIAEPQQIITAVNFISEKPAKVEPPAVSTPQPLRIDTRKRPAPPKLTIPGNAQQSTHNAITSTTVAGMTTNIYVPPTPSKTQFGDAPFSPRTAPSVSNRTFKSDGQKSVFEFFSPEEVRAHPSPPPKDRYRFSDPTTPTPASVRSIRSLSWNGRTQNNFQTMPLKSPISPHQLRTPNIYSPKHHNWIPMDIERESMQTHPHSRIVSFASQVQQIRSKQPSNASKTSESSTLKPIPAAEREDEIITDDEGSIIESDDEDESGDESTNTVRPTVYIHNNRSSVRTGRTNSTRFSQDSIPNPPLTPFFGNVSPFIKGLHPRRANNVSGTGTPIRTLSSPGLEIVTRPGDESPPLSPVTFRIDNNPLGTPKLPPLGTPKLSSLATPKLPPLPTPKLPFSVDPQDRIDADRTNDGTYPLEWKREIERQMSEEEGLRPQMTILKKSSSSSLRALAKGVKRKGVSFRLGNHARDNSDEKPILPAATQEVSLAETMQRIRPSWYASPRTDDSEMSMF
ncbi:hypothetical protein ABW20_dc0101986 [Dactylellina cionopaga]|nr:hypothetical protein ABW20_dc0101986 [Dactylellina cionopaga]